MNERLKQLVEQAFDTAEYPADQRYRIEPNSAFCKKFAELIVRECIVIVDKWSYDGPYREEGDIIPVKKIKEHFGVEE
jgi:hypothetical protein